MSSKIRKLGKVLLKEAQGILETIKLTPITGVSEREQRKQCETQAKLFTQAGKILSCKKYVIRDWCGEIYEFRSYDKADKQYDELLKRYRDISLKPDIQFFALLKEANPK